MSGNLIRIAFCVSIHIPYTDVVRLSPMPTPAVPYAENCRGRRVTANVLENDLTSWIPARPEVAGKKQRVIAGAGERKETAQLNFDRKKLIWR